MSVLAIQSTQTVISSVDVLQGARTDGQENFGVYLRSLQGGGGINGLEEDQPEGRSSRVLPAPPALCLRVFKAERHDVNG